MSNVEVALIGRASGHGDEDAADADADESADLQKLEADRAAGRFGDLVCFSAMRRKAHKST